MRVEWALRLRHNLNHCWSSSLDPQVRANRRWRLLLRNSSPVKWSVAIRWPSIVTSRLERPSQARQQRALVPHHLLDVAEPGQPFTAGEYARQARAAIAGNCPPPAAAHRSWGHGPLSASACWKGCSRDRNVPKNYASAFANARRNGARRICIRLLVRLDPAAAAKIHPHDAPKIIRAVEVCLASRAPMSRLWEERGRDPLRGFRILRIGLNPQREALYARLNQRACQMFDNGLIEETQSLLQRYGGQKSVTPLDSYRLQAGNTIFARRAYARAGGDGDAARASQLCQAADDLVSPRAWCDLAGRLRG